MSKRQYTLSQIASGIIVPVLVLVLALGAYFFLLPKYKDVKQTRKQFSLKREDLSIRQQNLINTKNLIADFAQRQKDIERVDAFLPVSAQIPDLLANFDSLAKQSGLSISGLEITSANTLANAQIGQTTGKYRILQEIVSKTDGLGVMEANLSLTGRYPNLKGFLLNLEQNLRLMDIQLLSFSEPEADSKIQQYTLRIYIYYQRD